MVAAAAAIAFSAIATSVTAIGVAAGAALASAGLTGVGFSVGLAASEIGLGITTFGAALAAGSISAWATTIAVGGSLASLLLAKPPPSVAGQLQMKLDPQAPIPIMFGRTATGGNVVYRETWGSNNRYASLVNVLSVGQIQSIDAFYADDFLVNFGSSPLNSLQSSTSISPNGGNTKMFVNRIRQEYRLGVANEATLQTSQLADPNMTATSKLSGLAHVLHVYDYNQDAFPNLAIPNGLWVGHGILCYDPRLDSTFAGGSGPQRLGNQSTYAWSQNPYICALNWCLGIFDSGNRVAGVGADLSQIDVASFVAAANIADANGWTCGGVSTTSDDKYQVLTSLLQAGSGQPITRGGKISVFVNTPLTSLYTVTESDVIGQLQVTNTTAYRDRKNRIVPQYREETQFWNIIAGDLVAPADFLAEDGGQLRTIEPVYSYVQNITQANQLATYDLCNSREFLTFSIICKPYLAGYEVGQSITLNLPEIGAVNQPCVIISKDFDPATWQVSLKLRSETASKHAFALGQSSVAPPAPALTVPLNLAPGSQAWAITAETSTGSDGSSVPALVINGACDDTSAQNVIFEYSTDATNWQIASKGPALTTTSCTITGLTYGQTYYVAVGYESVRGVVGDRLVLGPVEAGVTVASYVAAIPVSYGQSTSVTYTNKTLNLPVGLTTNGSGQLYANNIVANGTTVDLALGSLSNAISTAEAQATYTANSALSNAVGNLNNAIALLAANSNTVAGSVTTLQANVAGANATIQAIQVAQAANNYTVAGQINTLFANVAGANASISHILTAQASNNSTFAGEITNLQARTSLTGYGINLLANPSFQLGNADWDIFFGGIADYGQFGTALQYDPGSGDLGYNYRQCALSQNFGVAPSTVFSFQAIMYSGGVGSSSVYQRCVIHWMDSSGNGVGGDQTLVQTNQSVPWTKYIGDASNGLNVTSPSGAAQARIYLDILSTSGDIIASGDNFLWGSLKLEAGSYCTPYSDNQIVSTIVQNNQAFTTANAALSQSLTNLQAQVGNAVATIGTNTQAISDTNNALSFSDTLLSTAIGQVGSNVAVNTGAITTLNNSPQVQAQAWWNVQATTPGGTALIAANSNNYGTNIQLVANKVYFGSGITADETTATIQLVGNSHMKVMGCGFGSSNQFVEWFGPQMNLSSCTEQNAVSYLKIDGSAYFGGSLSAGTLTTKAATSDTSTSAQAETAVFGSRGGTITVTLSYSYSDFENAQYAPGAISSYNSAKSNIPNVQPNDDGSGGFTASGSDPGSYSVALYRSVNGGAMTQVATLSGTGAWSAQGDPPQGGDPGYISYSDSAGGSLTYTDPQTVAQNRQYQAVLTSRDPRYAGGISQNISIICVEQ